MLDLCIRGGTLFDGKGSPGRRADLGIRDGRVVAIGELDEPASETIDATDRFVAPGFIDIHTHYDAQVFWDPMISPSCFHGVTTIIGGNCGFSIAPLADDAADYLMRMLARVEGMPLESLEQGVPWSWQSFGEYLAAIEGKIALNAGFLVGHSALRRVVMGERAISDVATPAELAEMEGLLDVSLAVGGLGFSTSTSGAHLDGENQPVPSRFAAREEILALCRVAGGRPGTSLEIAPGTGQLTEDEKSLMVDMSRAADRPLNWNLVAANSTNPELVEHQLATGDQARAEGACVIALTVPQPMGGRMNLASGVIYDTLPGWAEVMSLPHEERKAALRDPAVRERLARGAEQAPPPFFSDIACWERTLVDETFTPANRDLEGRRIGEIAAERGDDAFDTLLDLALSEDLRTSFLPEISGQHDEAAWSQRQQLWRDPRALIGASDAGAHLDMLDTFAFSTQVLGEGVRKRGLVSWEEAIHQMSGRPAALLGLHDRGALEVGHVADVVVFDPQRVGTGPIHTRSDLPSGAGRLYAEAEGVDDVVVGGRLVVREGQATEARPGKVLRSGRDTRTVTAAEAQRL